MKSRIVSIFTLMLFIATQALCLAEESGDAYARLREEEIHAKQTRVEEFSDRITAMQKQLEEDRKSLSRSQEKLWTEFTGGIEAEKKTLEEKMNALSERQKLFEREMDRKRQEDEVRIREKETEVSRLSSQMERLRNEIEDDQKLLASRLQELRNSPPAPVPVKGEAGSEVLGNQAIKISQMSGLEMMSGTGGSRRQVQNEYFIEMGDVLNVEVWRVPDLSRSVTVRPDGRISMPVVGDIDVVGLSLVQFKELLTQKISDYVWNPQVSITVETFGGRKFIILGEIAGPGVYRYQSEVSLIEAIALAGGFRDYTKRGKIMIIRGDIRKNPQVKIISANTDNILKKGMLTENLTILPNDIIYVTKNILGDYREVIDQFISPTLSLPTDFFVMRSAIITAKNRRY